MKIKLPFLPFIINTSFNKKFHDENYSEGKHYKEYSLFRFEFSLDTDKEEALN